MISIAGITRAARHSDGASSDFDLNPEVVLPGRRVLRDAAVLVGLMDAEEGPRILLTKRSSRLKHHPGQIAFPGGKTEEGETAESAALREASEEVGLSEASVLCHLPSHETVTGFTVTPILAEVPQFDPVPEAGEVAEVFSIPASHLLEPANYTIEARRWRGEWRRYYAVPYGPYYVWGATARILRGLAERVHEDRS
ncbi:NUDIX hydrolase [Jannaschia aquimarina]|uniref:MutT protein n=1 Tax=Jannaschia aquimarina TaxID=935700 RepID=A0A0D1EH63_9RHOB|nr:CoA pyrophosphatase [Jannaschia aquimarina]KIT17014.1 8-oxo-dGTP diphosphatase [Jannaschia aquimarina]SNS81498.1 ADP-ribose pyrophosphatase YjhB, NUDIX family [Jannaschia aquimarina]